MEMGVDKLKNVRAQRHLWCVLLFCAVGMKFAYILCATRAQMNEVCVLAFFPVLGQPTGNRPLFRPCRPHVAILGARWGRNRSPPGQAPCRAVQGRFCADGRRERHRYLFSLPKSAG